MDSPEHGDAPRWRLGVRAHDFGRAQPYELAQRVARVGFTCVQLAVNKALPGPDRTVETLTPEFAVQTRDGFVAGGVSVAVLGCYINPLHPDPVALDQRVRWFTRHLELAASFGCDVVALESGSLQADYSPHPDNHGAAAFARCVTTLKRLATAAEKAGVYVGLEGVAFHSLHTPQRLRQAVDAVGSDALRIVFDPVNLLTAANHAGQRELVDEAVQLLGDRIVAVHLKDFVVEGTTTRSVPAGEGQLDYAYLFKRLRQSPARQCAVLEDVSPESASRALAYVRRFVA